MPGQSPYDDLVMDHIRNARNFRVPETSNRQSHGSNPLCGDEVTVYLKLNGDRVEDAAFQCTCCGISMASASMLTESVAGLSVAEALRHTRRVIEQIGERSGSAASPRDEKVEALRATVREFPTRAGCATLPWLTLEAALEGRPTAAVGPTGA